MYKRPWECFNHPKESCSLKKNSDAKPKTTGAECSRAAVRKICGAWCKRELPDVAAAALWSCGGRAGVTWPARVLNP